MKSDLRDQFQQHAEEYKSKGGNQTCIESLYRMFCKNSRQFERSIRQDLPRTCPVLQQFTQIACHFSLCIIFESSTTCVVCHRPLETSRNSFQFMAKASNRCMMMRLQPPNVRQNRVSSSSEYHPNRGLVLVVLLWLWLMVSMLFSQKNESPGITHARKMNTQVFLGNFEYSQAEGTTG